MSIFIIFCIFINTIVSAKYILEEKFDVANINIDREKPKIELMNIENTNTDYKKYANENHKIKVKINIKDKNVDKINEEYIKIQVGKEIVKTANINLINISNINENHVYEIELSEIKENGILSIIFEEGFVNDLAGWKNEEKKIDTNILIDNIKPVAKFIESRTSDGKVLGIIELNENIRNLEGWKFFENNMKAKKEFTNNISYELPLVDYAGNKNMVEVKINQATYLKISYASHNSEVGWSFGYGNYDIAGKKAIEKNPMYKTESLAFNISGNVEKDFVQANAYIYSYWGENSKARCLTYKNIYNFGYNPGKLKFKSMLSEDLIDLQGLKYFQFGGSGINQNSNVDINGNNPIPNEFPKKYKYGISGIIFKLKEYSQFSVIYQILQEQVGWIETKCDGEECMYKSNLPISAFRIALIPKSEKQYVIDTWNKDIGTKNIK